MAFDPDVEVVDMYLKTKIEKLSKLPSPIPDDESKVSIYYTPTERSVNSRRNSPVIPEGIHINMIEGGPPLPPPLPLSLLMRHSQPQPSPGSPIPSPSKVGTSSRHYERDVVEGAKPSSEPLLGREHTQDRARRKNLPTSASSPELCTDSGGDSDVERERLHTQARVLLAVEVTQTDSGRGSTPGHSGAGECVKLCENTPL